MSSRVNRWSDDILYPKDQWSTLLWHYNILQQHFSGHYLTPYLRTKGEIVTIFHILSDTESVTVMTMQLDWFTKTYNLEAVIIVCLRHVIYRSKWKLLILTEFKTSIWYGIDSANCINVVFWNLSLGKPFYMCVFCIALSVTFMLLSWLDLIYKRRPRVQNPSDKITIGNQSTHESLRMNKGLFYTGSVATEQLT